MNFETYQNTLHKLLTHFSTRSITSENCLSNHLSALIAETMASSYKLLDALPTSVPTTHFEIQTNPFSIKQYEKHKDYSYLSPLADIYEIVKNELSPFVDGFYLHGSLATMDYVKGWSDVDTFAVLSRETVTSLSSLLKLRPIFYKIHDLMKTIAPLQHHGVLVTTAIDFKSYDESILPLKVFERMKLMAGKEQQIKGFVKKSRPDFTQLKNNLKFIIEANKKGRFEHHAYSDEYLLSEYRNARNGMYQLKYYLEQFLLLPSLYLTAINKGCYKKDSFAKVRSIFPNVTMEWIDLISELREEWGKAIGENYEPNEIPAWVRNKIPSDYFMAGANAAEALLEHIKVVEKTACVSE
jgi:predicted nucleotidyltransferase